MILQVKATHGILERTGFSRLARDDSSGSSASSPIAVAAGAKMPGITIRCSDEERSKPYVLAAAGILFTTGSVGKTRLIRFRHVPRETGRELLNRTEQEGGNNSPKLNSLGKVIERAGEAG